MYLKIDNYTDFELNINKANQNAKSWDDKWCEVTLRIENEYFKYKTTDNELLLEAEIETLIVELNKLLRGELVEHKHIDFLEPDLEFTLIPIHSNNSGLVEIKINLFQNGALSADYYNLCIDTEEIENLLIYLNTVIPTIKLDKSRKRHINTETDSYCVVSVKYCDYDGDKIYDYILSKEIDSADIGDKVLVDRAGNEVLAQIVSKNFYNKNSAIYPIEKTKEVIKIIKDD